MEWEVRWPDGSSERVSPNAGESWDWKPAGPGMYDVRMGTQNVRVEALSSPDAQGFFRIRVNGLEQEIQVLSHQHLLLESMGMTGTTETIERHVEAPMPGKVLEVKVASGDQVKAGDALLVLEAMKMENVLRAPRDGVVERVDAVVGIAVEKGAALVTYEMN